MNLIEHFFSEDHRTFQIGVFTIVFILCWNLEYLFGISKNYSKSRHFLNNFLVAIPGALVQLTLGAFFLKMLNYENVNQIGLLSQLSIRSNVGQLLFSFVFLDFIYWLYHFIMHKTKLLWRFHAVHHSDKILNVSTSLREHPVETMVRLSHYILAVGFLGPYIWIISLHQFVQIISKIIIHGNFRLPEKTDKYLSYLILTPNMHHAHHHFEQPFTDSNYGDLFSIWDHLFGTFSHLTKDQVKFGLDLDVFAKDDSPFLKVKGLLQVPFSKNKLSN